MRAGVENRARSRMLRHEEWASPISSAGMIRIRFEGCVLSPTQLGHPHGNANRRTPKNWSEYRFCSRECQALGAAGCEIRPPSRPPRYEMRDPPGTPRQTQVRIELPGRWLTESSRDIVNTYGRRRSCGGCGKVEGGLGGGSFPQLRSRSAQFTRSPCHDPHSSAQ
jgi:hypothetical protein